jgi:hypothetical protein
MKLTLYSRSIGVVCFEVNLSSTQKLVRLVATARWPNANRVQSKANPPVTFNFDSPHQHRGIIPHRFQRRDLYWFLAAPIERD